MKSLCPLLLCLLGSPVILRAAPVDSRISAATVYTDRAVVTRTAEVDLAPGESALVFEHLPASLVDQSLQFSARGTAAATILDVNAQTAFVDFTPNARVKELEDQVRGLQKQHRTLDDRAGVLGDEREFVKQMLHASTRDETYTSGSDAVHAGAAVARPTLEEWQKLYTYSEETLGKIAAEIQSLDDQRDDLKAKEAALAQQLNELRGAKGKSLKNVTVRVAMASAGRLEVTLKYAVPGGGWTPSYDARLSAAARAIELTYFGMVRNGTGEDWNSIALTLSTARPSMGGGAPGLRPWVVDVARPVTRFEEKGVLTGGRIRTDLIDASPAASDVTKQFLSAPGGQAFGAQEAVFDNASIGANATSATFKITASVSVPADNSVQKISIVSTKLPANLQYQATPKMVETAFLSAEAFNNTDYPFLSGSMSTFLDDTFIATSHLRTVMPGEKFELQLGADEGIAIKRRLVNRFAENAGLTSNGRRITYEYLVTVTNNKKTAERVLFRESLPVSRNEKIEVKLLVPDEKDVGTKESPMEVTREEEGKLVWRLDLKPSEKREIPLKFSVEYPADLNVSGLE
jgi:uncharacterized protein (TIGR02231 family)